MGLHAYAHASVPIFWMVDTGAQPPGDACAGLPPIAGFVVAFDGCDDTSSVVGFLVEFGECGADSSVAAITEGDSTCSPVWSGTFGDCDR
jgi:hypothetical protein